MGKRKISILNTAAEGLADTAFFIESKGLPETAKKFVSQAFDFFQSLADDRINYRLCIYKRWRDLGYRCVTYRKKFVVAYIVVKNEVVICDFVIAKLLE